MTERQSKIIVEHKGKKERKVCLRTKRLLAYDMFGSTVNLNFNDGESQYRSSCGAVLSLLFTLITLLFAIQQTIVLIDYKNTSFTTSV